MLCGLIEVSRFEACGKLLSHSGNVSAYSEMAGRRHRGAETELAALLLTMSAFVIVPFVNQGMSPT